MPPNNMHTSPNRPSPRGVDERRDIRSTYYEDSDMYEAVPSPTRNEAPIPQPHYQQQQQRIIPDQNRILPAANRIPVNSGTANGQRPPSYGSNAYEEALMQKPDANEQRLQQQQRRRGYRRSSDQNPPEEQLSPTIHQQQLQQQQLANTKTRPTPNTRSSSQQNQPSPTRGVPTNQLQQSPTSPTHSSPTQASTGASIPRLQTPSLHATVLQPLDAKVKEYGSQMLDETKLMEQLDAEMAALQERRRASDNRYMAAKTKHDDYRRQYLGVERALSGQPVPARGIEQEREREERGMDDRDGDCFDDDDDRPSTQHTARPPHTATSRTESWSSVQKSQNGSGGRFRMSKIFGLA